VWFECLRRLLPDCVLCIPSSLFAASVLCIPVSFFLHRHPKKGCSILAPVIVDVNVLNAAIKSNTRSVVPPPQERLPNLGPGGLGNENLEVRQIFLQTRTAPPGQAIRAQKKYQDKKHTKKTTKNLFRGAI
jgi:hypothetical protein